VRIPLQGTHRHRLALWRCLRRTSHGVHFGG
jgi:hypothetical protein